MPGPVYRTAMWNKNPHCAYCGVKTVNYIGSKPRKDWNAATIDHVLPKATKKGVLDTEFSNHKLCCLWCNGARPLAGHCIAALRCAESVVGGGNLSLIAWFFRPTAVRKSSKSKKLHYYMSRVKSLAVVRGVPAKAWRDWP